MGRPMVGLRQDFAIGGDAFGHAQPPLARNDRHGLVLKQVVHVGAEVAPDLENVAKTLRRQQGRVAELALEHRVGDEGGAVHEQGHVACVDARKLDSAFDRGDERTGGVAAAARHLGDGDLAGLLVQHRDVGEGAADVHPESYRAHRPALRYCAAAPAASISSTMRIGEMGASPMRTANGTSAFSTAEAMAAAAGIVPASPTPFTPSGFRVDGNS